jgi:hypothetical protein
MSDEGLLLGVRVMIRLWLLIAVIVLLPAADCQSSRETPAQMRRILAQSFCLAAAYPNSDLARDAEAVYALYAPLLGVRDPLAARRKVEALVAAENPGKPTPVGERNLALAKCTLFAERKDVMALLTPDKR